MSVNVEFTPEGQHGVVAEGTYLWDAAKRLGVRLPAECEGRGECDTCAVVVAEGATLLSGLTDAERKILSPERLAAGERLACPAKIEADMAYETLVRAVDIPFDLFGKGLELLAGRGRRISQSERAARRPAEKKPDAPGAGEGEGGPEP